MANVFVILCNSWATYQGQKVQKESYFLYWFVKFVSDFVKLVHLNTEVNFYSNYKLKVKSAKQIQMERLSEDNSVEFQNSQNKTLTTVIGLCSKTFSFKGQCIRDINENHINEKKSLYPNNFSTNSRNHRQNVVKKYIKQHLWHLCGTSQQLDWSLS